MLDILYKKHISVNIKKNIVPKDDVLFRARHTLEII